MENKPARQEKGHDPSLTGWAQSRLGRANRMASLSGKDTGSLVRRIFNQVERSQVWVPDIGPVSPSMVDRFTGMIVQRYPLFAGKFDVETMKENEGEEASLVLPPLSPIFSRARRTSWTPETPMPANLFSETPPPASPEQPGFESRTVISSPPAVQRKPGVRPVSRLEMVSTGSSSSPIQPDITPPAPPSTVDLPPGIGSPAQASQLPAAHHRIQRQAGPVLTPPVSGQQPAPAGRQPGSAETAFPSEVPDQNLQRAPSLRPELPGGNPPAPLPASQAEGSAPLSAPGKSSVSETKVPSPGPSPREPAAVERFLAESTQGLKPPELPVEGVHLTTVDHPVAPADVPPEKRVLKDVTVESAPLPAESLKDATAEPAPLLAELGDSLEDISSPVIKASSSPATKASRSPATKAGSSPAPKTSSPVPPQPVQVQRKEGAITSPAPAHLDQGAEIQENILPSQVAEPAPPVTPASGERQPGRIIQAERQPGPVSGAETPERTLPRPSGSEPHPVGPEPLPDLDLPGQPDGPTVQPGAPAVQRQAPLEDPARLPGTAGQSERDGKFPLPSSPHPELPSAHARGINLPIIANPEIPASQPSASEMPLARPQAGEGLLPPSETPSTNQRTRPASPAPPPGEKSGQVGPAPLTGIEKSSLPSGPGSQTAAPVPAHPSIDSTVQRDLTSADSTTPGDSAPAGRPPETPLPVHPSAGSTMPGAPISEGVLPTPKPAPPVPGVTEASGVTEAAPLPGSPAPEKPAPPLALKKEAPAQVSEPSSTSTLQPKQALEGSFSPHETPELTLSPVSLRGKPFRSAIEGWATDVAGRLTAPIEVSHISRAAPQISSIEPPSTGSSPAGSPSIQPQGRTQIQRAPAGPEFSHPGSVEPVSPNLSTPGSQPPPAFPSMPLVTGIPAGRQLNPLPDLTGSTLRQDSQDGLATAVLPSLASIVSTGQIQRYPQEDTMTRDMGILPGEMVQREISPQPSPEESQEEEEEMDLDELVRKIYPLIKRMLAVERERVLGR